MSVIDLKVNRNLLDIKFEGYKLSLDPIPVLRQPVISGVKFIDLGNEDYSYAHTRMNLLLNHLFQDPWSPNSVFYVNKKNCILWSSLGQDDCLHSSRMVYEVNEGATDEQANVTVSFPGLDWTVLCNGRAIDILHTPSRAAGEPWTCHHTYNFEKSSTWYLMHAVHRTVPGGQQIDCILGSVVHKSNLPSEISNQTSSAFMSVIEWISFSCGQNIQSWITKRTRKLLSSSYPDYSAIDCSGDAVCIVSKDDFKFFFDSDGLIQETNDTVKNKAPEQSKYTYIQTPEDITVFFRVPEGTKKTDIQVNFCPMKMEVLLQDKSVLDGHLANCIDMDGSTWILDGEKLEVTLSKAEVGLMWQELVKGDKQGDELMDHARIDEIHAQLAHLTSETEVTSSDVPFNMEQLEECDSSSEPLTFQRIDGNNHQETHRVNMGGHQWLFTTQIAPEELPAICLRHDVDGILWQPKNVFNEGELEHFKMEHVATFSALGYVQASKQDKKFTFCSPDFSYSVISDCSRHIYMYCQPESLHSNFELRNRKTGESIAHIAKQYVISLEDCDKIMGVQVSKECIFILSKNMLYVAKVSAK